MNTTENSKSLLESRTIWGIVATVLLSVGASFWKGYRDTDTWQGGIDNALPVLITVFPAAYAGHGRKIAKLPIK